MSCLYSTVYHLSTAVMCRATVGPVVGPVCSVEQYCISVRSIEYVVGPYDDTDHSDVSTHSYITVDGSTYYELYL